MSVIRNSDFSFMIRAGSTCSPSRRRISTIFSRARLRIPSSVGPLLLLTPDAHDASTDLSFAIRRSFAFTVCSKAARNAPNRKREGFACFTSRELSSQEARLSRKDRYTSWQSPRIEQYRSERRIRSLSSGLGWESLSRDRRDDGTCFSTHCSSESKRLFHSAALGACQLTLRFAFPNFQVASEQATPWRVLREKCRPGRLVIT